MNVALEISLYPLDENFKEIILRFIATLHGREGIRVETNGMSTQIFGDYDLVTGTVLAQLKEVFAVQKSVAVLKIIGKPEAI
ncbi:MAG: hypothetical protein HYV28_17470 [Ignavibacteriales bacterium]|nr:hypothetical protein [Ignavibacteriales bacterium]